MHLGRVSPASFGLITCGLRLFTTSFIPFYDGYASVVIEVSVLIVSFTSAFIVTDLRLFNSVT